MGISLDFEFDISRWWVKPPHFMGYNRHLFKKEYAKTHFLQCDTRTLRFSSYGTN